MKLYYRTIITVVENSNRSGNLENLIQNMKNLIPCNTIQDVSYETGYMLYDDAIRDIIRKTNQVFETFLKSYFKIFEFKSINTEK